MAQMGFFDVENRYAALDAKHDPLVKINAVVPWEASAGCLAQAARQAQVQGGVQTDAIVMFKAISALYNLG